MSHGVYEGVSRAGYELAWHGFFRMEENCLVFGNPVFMGLFGFSTSHEFSNITLSSLFADLDQIADIQQKLMHNGIVAGQRILCRKRNGQNFWGLLDCQVFRDNARGCIEGTITNITDQVTTETLLIERTNELEKIKLELDRFIYSASHDIRSPVSTILGIINLIKIDTTTEIDKKYTDMLDKSVKRLDHFVHGLVEYAKNSRKAIDDFPVDISLLLDDLFSEFKTHHPNFELVTFTTDIKHGFAFYCDIERMLLILRNVIKNALDYQDLKKSKKIISIELSVEPDRLNMRVFDNGIGIAAVHLAHVFEMFYRGTDTSKGSGIGLYLTREAVIKLGGTITLHSQYGIGTSVHIVLPNSKKGRLINKKTLLRMKQ